ncbi:hypothetical protein [Lyticum sinuosum]|uniref:Uncharacterized protein n=1 Tax=Lyticum sinuosum TaxID=1332059 RepID=A0AAE4VL53_9RICK|nr:hypothetical protein [Lyticum sinuosum]MDZ5761182.1 hypothetical protein [Lyticum sinuosum]
MNTDIKSIRKKILEIKSSIVSVKIGKKNVTIKELHQLKSSLRELYKELSSNIRKSKI